MFDIPGFFTEGSREQGPGSGAVHKAVTFLLLLDPEPSNLVPFFVQEEA